MGPQFHGLRYAAGFALSFVVTAFGFLACGDGEDAQLEIPLDEITETPARYGEDDQVVVVMSEGEPRAYWHINAWGCRYFFLEAPRPRLPNSVFRDGCSGSTYDRAGNHIFGPSEEPLDRFEAEIDGEDFVIDLDNIVCEPADREPCPSEHRFPDEADHPPPTPGP
ncbi:MAG: hypothetical protein GEU28_09505 [Dehalococcoidia bacterium]|nr:hypothetical protein [Dehalococcoidia bacterium]